jgi:hypothetical protein
MGCAREDLQGHAPSIARRKLMEQILTRARPVIVVVLATDEYADFRVNEVREIRTGPTIVEPANGVQRDSRSEVIAWAKDSVTVVASHHQHRLDSSQGKTEESEPSSIDFRPRDEKAVSATYVG